MLKGLDSSMISMPLQKEKDLLAGLRHVHSGSIEIVGSCMEEVVDG
jgi:hypothetical protein